MLYKLENFNYCHHAETIIICKTCFGQITHHAHKLNYLLEKGSEHPYELRHKQQYTSSIDIPYTEHYKK